MKFRSLRDDKNVAYSRLRTKRNENYSKCYKTFDKNLRKGGQIFCLQKYHCSQMHIHRTLSYGNQNWPYKNQKSVMKIES